MQDADEMAKIWETKAKADAHQRIQFAVENGILTHDQGVELINDEEKADKWIRDGIL